ncbi:MAG TPA: hypothetical protein VHN99_11480 [Deinococcales bacterium]|nr:hypothetical protein [Deinococcales bacterium]
MGFNLTGLLGRFAPSSTPRGRWEPLGEGLEDCMLDGQIVEWQGSLLVGRFDGAPGVFRLVHGETTWRKFAKGLPKRERGGSTSLRLWPDGTLTAQDFVFPDSRQVFQRPDPESPWVPATGEKARWLTTDCPSPAGILAAGFLGQRGNNGIDVLGGKTRHIDVPGEEGIDEICLSPSQRLYLIRGGNQALMRSTPQALATDARAEFSALPLPGDPRKNYQGLVEGPNGSVFVANAVNLAGGGPKEGRVYRLNERVSGWDDITANLPTKGADWRLAVGPEGTLYAWAYEIGIWRLAARQRQWHEMNAGLEGGALVIYGLTWLRGGLAITTGDGAYIWRT